MPEKLAEFSKREDISFGEFYLFIDFYMKSSTKYHIPVKIQVMADKKSQA